jgi:hypothetical protein
MTNPAQRESSQSYELFQATHAESFSRSPTNSPANPWISPHNAGNAEAAPSLEQPGNCPIGVTADRIGPPAAPIHWRLIS